MTKRDRELAEILEAVRYTRNVLIEGPLLDAFKQGIRSAGEKIGLLKPTSTSTGINWNEVIRTRRADVQAFVHGLQVSDRNNAYDKLSGPYTGHPEIQNWALKNISADKNTLFQSLNNPKNPELRAEAIKAGERIEKLLPKLWAEAKNALLNVGQAAAKPSSKPNENKEIQDIAKIITEDIRTNNGIILENQWDVPFPQPNFRSAVFREFFEFLEQKGINPPVAVVGAGDLSRKEGRAIRYLNSLVSEFLGIDRENDIKPPPSSFMKSGKGY